MRFFLNGHKFKTDIQRIILKLICRHLDAKIVVTLGCTLGAPLGLKIAPKCQNPTFLDITFDISIRFFGI